MSVFCENCGASLDDKVKQCPYCGAQIVGISNVIQKTSRQSKKKRSHKAGLIVIILVVCLGVAASFVVSSVIRRGRIEKPANGLNDTESSISSTQQAPEIDTLLSQQFGNPCQCGESAYWKLSSTKDTLVIFGTGSLYEDDILQNSERPLSYQDKELIKYIVVDEGISKLSRNNFGSWTIDWLYLPSTLEEIDGAFYAFAKISQIKLDAGNTHFAMKDDILFNSDFTSLVKYPGCKESSSYEPPQTIKVICNDAFCGNEYLEKIQISSPTEVIGSHAFAKMSALKEITISDSVTKMGNSVFFGCEKLESVILPNGIEILPEGIFNSCISLKSISIPEGVNYISTFSFDGCENLEKVVMPSTIKTIAALAFRDCKSLKEINLPEGLKSLGSNTGVFENDKGKVFQNCTSLKEIIIPASVSEIRWGVFSGWTENQTIYFRADSPGYEWKKEWSDNCNANIIWGYKD